jgi:hypothetical protein
MMPEWTFYRHSDIPASMHPCMSTLQVHAAWPNPCCVSMSMLHVHVHTACPCPYCMPCPCCMFMSILHAMLHVHDNAAFHVNAQLCLYLYLYLYLYLQYLYLYLYLYIYIYKLYILPTGMMPAYLYSVCCTVWCLYTCITSAYLCMLPVLCLPTYII